MQPYSPGIPISVANMAVAMEFGLGYGDSRCVKRWREVGYVLYSKTLEIPPKYQHTLDFYHIDISSEISGNMVKLVHWYDGN